MFNMSMRIKRMEMILGGQLIFHDAMWWLESGRQLRQAISSSENQQELPEKRRADWMKWHLSSIAVTISPSLSV